MQLDLRFQRKLPLPIVRELNRIAWDIRADFNNAIDAASRNLSGDHAWLASGPASRNTLQSPLFAHCTFLVLLGRLVERNEAPEKVFADSPAAASLFDTIVDTGDTKVILSNRPGLFKRLVSGFMTAGDMGRQQWSLWKEARRIMPRVDESGTPLTLVDTFVIPGFEMKDRHYPGMVECLEEDEARSLYFVPTFVGVGRHRLDETLSRLRASGQSWLLKEHYLTRMDMLRSFVSAVRRSISPMPKALFRDWDISGLIEEELRSLAGFQAMFAGLLNIRFACRLAESGVPVRHVVNWFENQAQDRGWNIGFNTYFPDAGSIGYQAFPPIPLYMGTNPTKGEMEAGALPREVFAIGARNAGVTDEFCPGLPLRQASAFRYRFPPEIKRTGEDFSILVALSHHDGFSRFVVEVVREATSGLDGVRIRFKPHPMTSPDRIREIFNGEVPPDLVAGEAPFEEILAECDMFVGGYSTTVYQAMAMGKPAADILWRYGFSLYYWPGGIETPLLTECADPGDLRDAIERWRAAGDDDREQLDRCGRELREQLFAPVTRDSVLQLLGFACGNRREES